MKPFLSKQLTIMSVVMINTLLISNKNFNINLHVAYLVWMVVCKTEIAYKIIIKNLLIYQIFIRLNENI